MTDLELKSLLKKLSGSKNTAKQANIIRVVIKKRRGMNDYAIARELEMAYSTLRGWLVRIAERGLDGLYDIHISNNKYVLNDACKQIRKLVSKSPTEFGYESALWTGSLIKDIILRKLGIDVNPRTLCKALRRLQISYGKKRPKFRKSATPEEQKEFKIKAQKMIDALTKTGFITVYLDEMACRRPGGVSARGWPPSRA